MPDSDSNFTRGEFIKVTAATAAAAGAWYGTSMKTDAVANVNVEPYSFLPPAGDDNAYIYHGEDP